MHAVAGNVKLDSKMFPRSAAPDPLRVSNLPALRRELIERLGDALDTVPAVKDADLDREQLADVIVRLFASSWIIPESDERTLVHSMNRILEINPD